MPCLVVLLALISVAFLIGSGIAWATYRQFTQGIQHGQALPEPLYVMSTARVENDVVKVHADALPKIPVKVAEGKVRSITDFQQPITGLPTPQIIRRGLGSVPEARRLFGAMTVRENVLMGAFTRSDKADIETDNRSV